ncbi:hypothetical protein D3C72_1969220 [compost metagenome]
MVIIPVVIPIVTPVVVPTSIPFCHPKAIIINKFKILLICTPCIDMSLNVVIATPSSKLTLITSSTENTFFIPIFSITTNADV